MIDLNIYGKTVSFSVYPVSKLGDIYKSVKVLAIVDYDTARQFTDVAAIAVDVYPLLPAGTSKQYTDYKYMKVQHTNGSISYIALEWINQSTLTIDEDVIINVQVRSTNINTIEMLRKVLIGNNFEVISIN